MFDIDNTTKSFVDTVNNPNQLFRISVRADELEPPFNINEGAQLLKGDVIRDDKGNVYYVLDFDTNGMPILERVNSTKSRLSNLNLCHKSASADLCPPPKEAKKQVADELFYKMLNDKQY